ncbi:MAG: addiction module antidote protein [Alphaproteobacteria bacterium]|jgi:probable addiction module antidote protein
MTGKLPKGLTPFDPADYLTSEAAIAEYLTAAAEGGDTAHLARALGDVARARNHSQLARQTGMTRAGLHRALSGETNPSLETIMKIAAALGVRLTFAPAGRV